MSKIPSPFHLHHILLTHFRVKYYRFSGQIENVRVLCQQSPHFCCLRHFISKTNLVTSPLFFVWHGLRCLKSFFNDDLTFPQVHRKYTGEDFDEDLRTVLRRSGCKNEKIAFIMDESNVLDSGFLERMNTLLANGEVRRICWDLLKYWRVLYIACQMLL